MDLCYQWPVPKEQSLTNNSYLYSISKPIKRVRLNE